MRTVVVSNIVSVDGCYEGPGGDVMALNMDAAFDAYNLERIRAAGTVLLGRRSFGMFSSYWPFIADAPEDPENREVDEVNRELSRIYNAVEKVVVTDGGLSLDGNAWQDTTLVLTGDTAREWLRKERSGDGGDILTFGSRTLWNALLAEGLVDEVHLMVGPEALGGGTPLFSAPVKLRLLGAERREGSGNVLLRYAAEGSTD